MGKVFDYLNRKEIKKNILNFDGKDYEIKNILPTTFVRDVFLVYQFICKEK